MFLGSIYLLPVCIPGLLCDLLWSDPDKDVQGWGENDRGVSFTFGADVVSKFLNRHDLDLICRAHQVIGSGIGYESDCEMKVPVGTKLGYWLAFFFCDLKLFIHLLQLCPSSILINVVDVRTQKTEQKTSINRSFLISCSHSFSVFRPCIVHTGTQFIIFFLV